MASGTGCHLFCSRTYFYAFAVLAESRAQIAHTAVRTSDIGRPTQSSSRRKTSPPSVWLRAVKNGNRQLSSPLIMWSTMSITASPEHLLQGRNFVLEYAAGGIVDGISVVPAINACRKRLHHRYNKTRHII